MIIYEIKNKINNKPYIGYSTKFNSNKEFQNSKYWGSGTAIQNALQKYGIENFERKVLLKDIFDFEKLKEYEILWIQKKNTKKPNGYNITDGGSGIIDFSGEIGRKLSKDRIERGLSKGENNPMFGRTKEKHPMFGKHHTESTLKKISNHLKGENNPNFGKGYLILGEHNPNFGCKWTQEQKDKQSQLTKERMKIWREKNAGKL